VAVVASGTAGAQAITMGFSPVITRLYGPEAFGLLGVFMAMVQVLVPAAALTYPIAIVLPKEDRDARVLARLLKNIEELTAKRFYKHDHARSAKRRMLEIQYAKTKKVRTSNYKNLIKITEQTTQYAQKAVAAMESDPSCDLKLFALASEMKQYLDLASRVMDQARRRVINGETVPASEKVVSIFELHADIVVKDRRDTFYGHKVCLTGGASNLIVGCVITEGNPAYSTLVEQMFDRQNDIYGKYPFKAARDGGFVFKDNLNAAKERQIMDGH
jgi:IS5 family transposase